MKNKKILFVLLFSIFFQKEVGAKNMAERFGIGLDGAPGGAAISGRYYFTKNLSFGAQFGANFTKLKGIDPGFAFLFGGHGIYNFAEGRETNFGAFFEMNIFIADNNFFPSEPITGKNMPVGGGKTGVAITIGLGVRPEVFLAEEFAIHTTFGIEFLIGSEKFYKNRSLFSTNIGSLAHSALLGTFGFTYYF